MTVLLNVTQTESYLKRQTEKLANERARTAMNAGARFWLINLSGVDTIPSAGLRAMYGAYKMLNSQDTLDAVGGYTLLCTGMNGWISVSLD